MTSAEAAAEAPRVSDRAQTAGIEKSKDAPEFADADRDARTTPTSAHATGVKAREGQVESSDSDSNQDGERNGVKHGDEGRRHGEGAKKVAAQRDALILESRTLKHKCEQQALALAEAQQASGGYAPAPPPPRFTPQPPKMVPHPPPPRGGRPRPGGRSVKGVESRPRSAVETSSGGVDRLVLE